ncbi:MAG: hypothetical protein XXXJIFNMEKO3_00920 [Candidatus Erwinia impunctatus]|nr:hypothetical protein XXXJIFNMEKO_00920 [Culicoides impunctatus]
MERPSLMKLFCRSPFALRLQLLRLLTEKNDNTPGDKA